MPALEARAMSEAKPINPQRVFWELSPRLPSAKEWWKGRFGS